MYRIKEFRAFMRTLHGFTDEDFDGIVLSTVKKTTPLHEKERSQVMEAVSDTLTQIAKYPRRCCKRSSYIAIQKAVQYLKREGYGALNHRAIVCPWHAQNKMCLGSSCLFFRN